MSVIGLDHVQLAMPAGQEAAAREFYGDLLGLGEQPKPDRLAKRGGVWFARGTLKVHLGVEREFRPATRAHPAFIVEDLVELTSRLRAAGYALTEDEPIEGFDRIFVADPFGNRVELLQPKR